MQSSFELGYLDRTVAFSQKDPILSFEI